ncbi:type 2 lanthipeptide synthetase LanM family protein [Allokutzneria sp. A3M-2-11 16]|uniref:type 2 lanthipeptide synthetase LanM family protein n=1 Tax=Allokutzneria sp. A3M-2-11 16 TaxID=2962043 RepID=UPI0020B760D9|nr:type 2 lanthipeptide synthetase LanM family protein [Allokutzneria sp. A3M-2-11 16]MCP3802214.1 type 2 lanthipeptide synthetase LanM family protein [Allokutzneria sp. A3M-2-11 16]
MPVPPVSPPDSGWPIADLRWADARYLHELPATPVRDTKRAERRMGRWNTCFTEGSTASRRAAGVLGFKLDSLWRTFGSPTGCEDRSPVPDWLIQVHRVRGYGGPPQDERHLAADEELAGIRAVTEIVRGYQRVLHNRLRRLPATSGAPGLTRLPELVVAAWPRQRIADAMSGVADADEAGQVRLWNTYPVLLRYVNDVLRAWLHERTGFAQRLVRDHVELSRVCGEPLGELVSIDFDRGDRGVAELAFERLSMIYRPHSVEADRAWAAVCAWFNDRRPRHDLLPVPVLAKDGYGWMCHVAARPCRTEDEAKAFHWRIGALTALLYVLDGADAHHRNVIAHGEYPVLVDGQVLLRGRSAGTGHGAERPDPAAELMREGVLGVGMIGTRSLTRIAHPGRGGAALVTTLDEGAPVDPREHRDEMLAGFDWTYRAIAMDWPQWLAVGGLLSKFIEVPVRHVPRDPDRYREVLADSLRPEHLRDGVDRDRSLVSLSANDSGDQPRELLCNDELHALRVGVLPSYSTRGHSTQVWNREGKPLGPMLAEPPIDIAIRRIGELTEPSLLRQLSLLRQALDVPAPGRTTSRGPAPEPEELPGDPLRYPEAVADAVDLAKGLCRQAVRRNGAIGWITLTPAGGGHWELGPAPKDLRSGTAGIGLFLSTVAAYTGDTEIAGTAHTVADHLARWAAGAGDQLGRSALDRPDPGAFGSVGGLVHYLTHTAVLLERPDLLGLAQSLLRPLAAHVQHDQRFDLVSGSVGAILVALGLHQVLPGSQALEVAHAAGRRLVLSPALVPGTGIGISRGASGIAYALARLHAVDPRPEYAETVHAALRHERDHLHPERHDWTAPRAEGCTAARAPLLGWCHGVPGVGLARAGIAGLSGDWDVRDDLDAAERATALALFGETGGLLASVGDHGLCHGDLGALELLVLAAHRRSDVDGLRRCGQAARAVRDRGREAGWRTGPARPESVPGLMHGRAGIGYNLLRLVAPELVPSVLLLEPPRTP